MNDGVRILRHRYYDPDTEQVIPKDSPATAADGSMGWVVIHHSLDGRELRGHG